MTDLQTQIRALHLIADSKRHAVDEIGFICTVLISILEREQEGRRVLTEAIAMMEDARRLIKEEMEDAHRLMKEDVAKTGVEPA